MQKDSHIDATPKSSLVRWTRNSIYVIATVAAAVAGWLLYRREEVAQKRAFEAELGNVVLSLRLRVMSTVADTESLATATGRAFPYPPGGRAYFYNFREYSASVLIALDASSMVIAPLIMQSQIPELNAFLAAEVLSSSAARQNLSAVEVGVLQMKLGYGVAALQLVNGTIPTVLPYSMLSAAAAKQLDSAQEGQALPALQLEPHGAFNPLIFVDNLSDPNGQYSTKQVIASLKPAWTMLGIEVETTLDEGKLVSVAAAPSFYTHPNATKALTGVVGVTLTWENVFREAFEPRHTMDIIITELKAPTLGFAYTSSGLVAIPTPSYTMRIEGGVLRPVGLGDRRSSDGGDWARSFVLPIGPLSEVRIEIVPASNYVDQFVNKRPYDGMGVAVGVVSGIAFIFAVFDLVHSDHVRSVALRFASQRFADKLERESLQQRTVFARMVGHEIRTPASSICGALDLIRTTSLSSQQRQFLDIVASGAEAVLTLVEDMMNAGSEIDSFNEDGSKDTHFRLAPVRVDPVREIVHEAWESSCLQKRYAEKVPTLRLHVNVAADIPRVAFIDAGRARQILSNIIGNSLKFTPPHGTVTLTADYEAMSNLLRVRVADTGRGLSAEGLAKLFRPFAQAEGPETKKRFGGTGLGLCISRDIARALGGDLTLESEGLDKGCVATATMRLPGAGTHMSEERTGSKRGEDASARHQRHSAGMFLSVASLEMMGVLVAPHESPRPPTRSPSLGVVREDVGGEAPEDWVTRGAILANDAPGQKGDALDKTDTEGTMAPSDSRSVGIPRLPHRQVDGEVQIATGGAKRRSSLGRTSSFEQKTQIRVLAAEDDALCRRVLGMLLRSSGFECVGLVADGLEATALLSGETMLGAAASPRLPQVILMDVNMGGGEMDGLPTLARIRQLYADAGLTSCPVVFLSGEGDPRDHARYIEAGAARVILKPASLDNLSALRNLVGERSASTC